MVWMWWVYKNLIKIIMSGKNNYVFVYINGVKEHENRLLVRMNEID